MNQWNRVRLDLDVNQPLYTQIADTIREMVRAGQLAEGERIPPSSQLKDIFNVSVLTAENGVTLLVREGILHRRRRLGTFVASIPTDLPRPAVAHADINVVFGSERPGGMIWHYIVSLLEEKLKEHGYRIRLIYDQPESPETLEALTRDAAGIIMIGRKNIDTVKLVHSAKFPLVLVGDLYRADPVFHQVDSVINDNALRMFTGIQHLMGLRHRRILVLTGPANSPFEAEQKVGIQRAREEFQLQEDELICRSVADTHPERGFEAAYPELCVGSRVTSCLTSDVDLAIGVLRAADELGLKVPDDLSLVTLGSEYICSRVNPQVTCLGQDLDKMAEVVIHKLLNQMRSPRHRKSCTMVAAGEFHYGKSTMYCKKETDQ